MRIITITRVTIRRIFKLKALDQIVEDNANEVADRRIADCWGPTPVGLAESKGASFEKHFHPDGESGHIVGWYYRTQTSPKNVRCGPFVSRDAAARSFLLSVDPNWVKDFPLTYTGLT